MTAETPCTSRRELTGAEREIIGRARKLAAMSSGEMRAHTRQQLPALAMATALGEAQGLLRQLADIAARLAGEAGSSG